MCGAVLVALLRGPLLGPQPGWTATDGAVDGTRTSHRILGSHFLSCGDNSVAIGFDTAGASGLPSGSKLNSRGFSVIGFPCNQFGEQEPGGEEEIQTFCSMTYGVTFPMFAKVDVNGDDRHPLYRELTRVPDADGEAGDIVWNFEKFLVAPDGEVQRFRPLVAPEDPELVDAIEAALPR